MKKYKVIVNCEYLDGYLRYGHGEAIIEAENIEDAKNKAKTWDDYEIVVDDYALNDHGEFDFDNIEIEEVKHV